ncbi:GRAM domain-containing protein 1B isoform X2 [Agrilus planipennis]|uniref:GRAM domain-containing protein 1B isoform X2 n=1 Tax=Agrilus planipennis TaxID=224129 RepID=A0A7F5R4Q7_AGRPL|nr:GRAM domain-containing protein 1B isoform X2 [Agrilus planipennis]
MNIQPQNPSSEKQNELPLVETKSSTPKSSPRSSPRASPLPPRRESIHPADGLMIIFNSKDRDSIISTLKQDSSPSQESNKSLNIDGASSECLREKKEIRSTDKSKKKTAWYNVLYPTYKSRSEDFKRIFKDVPDDERLVVDYSCALQKEILVQGRLYASQNFLCFYANIFGWETCVTLKWRDVSAITKEKTALVIPNAILVCTKAEKFFLTSFTSRDKTFLMLFRIWQNALLDQPMSSQEMWQWVHQCYGDELGLTSDDDDYIPPGTDEDKLSVRLSGDSFSEEYSGGLCEPCIQMEPTSVEDDKKDANSVDIPQTLELQTNGKPTQVVPEVNLPTDMSDSSDSDDKNKFICDPKCSVPHEGRTMFNEVMPIHVDQLFTLLFTSSKFFLDFHASRKTTDLTQTAWTHNAENNTKSRVVNLTIPLMQTVGPKSAQVTENQIMQPCSKPGFLYSIDIEITNAGIPYADSFYVMAHYCLQRVSDTHSSLVVFAQIKYRKSVWGLVRGFIEKNVWVGMEDYFSTLAKALHLEGDEVLGPAVKRKSRRRRHGHSIIPPPEAEYVPIKRNDLVASRDKRGRRTIPTDFTTILIFAVLILLVILNVMLYYKLWSLEEAPPYTLLDLHILKEPPNSHEEWIKLLQKQETLHTIEMQKWQRVLKTSIQLLKQIEDSLSELQHSIHPTYTNKIMSVIQNHKDTLDKVQEEL